MFEQMITNKVIRIVLDKFSIFDKITLKANKTWFFQMTYSWTSLLSLLPAKLAEITYQKTNSMTFFWCYW